MKSFSPGGELEVGEEETEGMKRLLDLTLGRTDGVKNEWKIEVRINWSWKNKEHGQPFKTLKLVLNTTTSVQITPIQFTTIFPRFSIDSSLQ